MARRNKAPKQIVIAPRSGSYNMALRSAEEEIESLKARLESLETDKKLIEQRIQMVQGTITALSPLCADEEGAESRGLKDACLHVLKASYEPLSVPDIKGHLLAQGVQMSGYKNPLAVLHTTLNRMVGSGDAQKIDDKAGKVRFRRIG